jgi:hypothetical protein
MGNGKEEYCLIYAGQQSAPKWGGDGGNSEWPTECSEELWTQTGGKMTKTNAGKPELCAPGYALQVTE